MQQETGDSRPLPPCHDCIKSKWTICNRNNQLFCLIKLYWTKTITNYPLNMPSSVSISLVILVWINTTIIIINHVGSANTSTIAKPQSSPLAQEAKALNQTLWWWWNEENTSSHCKWNGIVCNGGGSVIEINLNYTEPHNRVQLHNFSFSSFPNLVRDRKSVV